MDTPHIALVVTTAAPTALATEPTPTVEHVRRRRNPAAGLGVIIVLAMAGLAMWYPASDREAPYASGASVTAFVTQVAPRVSGPVTEVLVHDNAEVKAGQPLFHIDPSTFQMDVVQAQAQLASVRQNMSAANAAVVAARAQQERALIALGAAKQVWDRASSLLDKGVMSEAKANEAESAYSNAQAAAEAAAADVSRLVAQAGPAGDSNPLLQGAEITLEKARFALANTTVTAPKNGYITNLSLAVGQYATAGQAVMTFIDPDTQAIVADFRENQLVNVEPGDKVGIVFEAYPRRVFHGKVDSVAWGINSGRTSVNGLAQSSNDTRWFPPARKIPVRVTLEDGEAMPAQLRLGSEASVLIFANAEGGLVPSISVVLMNISSWLAGFN